MVEALCEAIRLHGKPERVYADRGAAFTAWRDVTSCEQFLDEQLIDHSLRTAHRPQGGGKIESVIGTVQRELWEVVHFNEVAELTARSQCFRRLQSPLGPPGDRQLGPGGPVLRPLARGRRRDGCGQPRRQGALALQLDRRLFVEPPATGERVIALQLILVGDQAELHLGGRRVVLGKGPAVASFLDRHGALCRVGVLAPAVWFFTVRPLGEAWLHVNSRAVRGSLERSVRSFGLPRGADACVAAVAWARNRQQSLLLRRTSRPRPSLTVKKHTAGASTSTRTSSSSGRQHRRGDPLGHDPAVKWIRLTAPIGRSGESYPAWVRALRSKSGVYVIRERQRDGSNPIVYVGESHTSRLYQTLTRHFQTWRRAKKFWSGQYGGQDHDPGLTYDRARCTVAVRVLPAERAMDEEARLIARLRPRDNVIGQPEELGADEAVPF